MKREKMDKLKVILIGVMEALVRKEGENVSN